MLLRSKPRNSEIIFVISFQIFFAFFVSVSAIGIETTKTKYLFLGYDLAVVAETNKPLSYSVGRGSNVNCYVYPRDLPARESPQPKPAIVNVSDNLDDPDLPFTIDCYKMQASFAAPYLTICGIGKTPDGREGSVMCRDIAE